MNGTDNIKFQIVMGPLSALKMPPNFNGIKYRVSTLVIPFC